MPIEWQWLMWRETINVVVDAVQCDRATAAKMIHRHWSEGTLLSNGERDLSRFRFHRKHVLKAWPPSPIAADEPKTTTESEPAPQHKARRRRAEYRGDLAEFMARKGVKLWDRMDPKGIAADYRQDYKKRAEKGDFVPALPDISNRVERIATQVTKIREGMRQQTLVEPVLNVE
jgi:hypothetical protein